MVNTALKLRSAVLAAVVVVAAAVPGMAASASAGATVQQGAAQIVADMGAGWNLGNQLEASSNGYPSETAWGNPTVTQALIDSVKAAGFKSIRIPVCDRSGRGRTTPSTPPG